jgi:hypothetical protein
MSSTALSLSIRPASRSFSWARFAFLGLGTVVAAVAANTLFYFLGSTVVDYDPEFLPLANVTGAVIFTLVPAIIAPLLYAGLLRFTRNPARIFTIVSTIVFVLTAIPDFTYIPTVPGSTPAQTAVLVMMHVITASVIVRLLTTARKTTA